MAYMVRNRSGSWEIRQSQRSRRGPRSRTLATFDRLDEEVVARAIERSEPALSREALLADARRAGAPIAQAPVLEAASALTAELARGATLPDRWRRVIGDLIAEQEDSPPATDAERAAAAWADSSLEQRGHALRDLLSLADRVESPARKLERPRFPILRSRR